MSLSPRLFLPLAGTIETPSAAVPVEVSGSHRFLEIAGRTGYHPLSLATTLRLDTNLHAAERGSMELWVCPLESLGVAAAHGHFLEKDPHAQNYALVADSQPGNDPGATVFAWYWRAYWHPQMVAKFRRGAAGNAASDFSVIPYVPVEHLPLREREWYHLVFTWDKPASRFRIFVNGVLAGTTVYPFRAEMPEPQLYLGNPAMAFADFAIYDEELSADDIAARHAAAAVGQNPGIAAELRELFTATPKPAFDWQPDAAWARRYERSLTQPGDFDGWTQQGCLTEPLLIREKSITPEGLLLQTPDEVAVETRVYFWSPDIFEGDLAVEYEFRPEQDTGLALLVVQASGMQGEDFLTDHPPRTTGSMGTIIADRVRNYHWEYFRRAVDVRCDVAAQILAKNPWCHPLGMSTLPPLALHTWHRLQFVQEGDRLRAAINGQCVLDVRDEAFGNNGPVLRRGRIGLRLMYATRLRFRNLRVWNRPLWTEAP